MLGRLLAAGPGRRGSRVPCGRGHEAGFADYRDKASGSVLGPVTVNRAWQPGVAGASLSPGLAAMTGEAAAAGPFAKAAGPPEDLTGVPPRPACQRENAGGR